MSLGDSFPENIKRSFAERNIDPKKAILIKIPGIETSYPKYIIVVAHAKITNLMGFVVINSEINNRVFPTPYLKSLHVLISPSNHNFLKRDSYVNCTEIRSFSKNEVIQFLLEKPERVVGNVTDDVFIEIIDVQTNARTITKHTKRIFGLL